MFSIDVVYLNFPSYDQEKMARVNKSCFTFNVNTWCYVLILIILVSVLSNLNIF